MGLWDKVTGWVDGAIDSAEDTWNDTTEWASGVVEEVQEQVEDTAEDVGNWAEETWDNAEETVEEWTDGASDWVEDTVETVVETTEDWWDSTTETVNDAVETADDWWDNTTETVDEAIAAGQEWWDEATDPAEDWVEETAGEIVEVATEVGDRSRDAIDTVVDTVTDTVEDGWETAIETGEKVVERVDESVDRVRETVADTVTDTVSTVVEASAPVVETVRETVRQGVDTVTESIDAGLQVASNLMEVAGEEVAQNAYVILEPISDYITIPSIEDLFNTWTQTTDFVENQWQEDPHGLLQQAGNLPFFGTMFDLLDAGLYLQQGDYEKAVHPYLSSDPIMGNLYSSGRQLVQTDWWRAHEQTVHNGLDIAGFVPGVGIVADIANAGLYAAEGNWLDAGMSLVGSIPLAGDAAAGLYKGSKLAVKYGDDVIELGSHYGDDFIESGIKQADEVLGLPAPAPILRLPGPNPATLRLPGPSIHVDKQSSHFFGSPNFQNRITQGKPTSFWLISPQEANELTMKAWSEGSVLKNDPARRVWQAPYPVGLGKNGGYQTQIATSRNTSNQIHGYPYGDELRP
jgi:hypothetical protein